MNERELEFYGNKTLDVLKLRQVKERYEDELRPGYLCHTNMKGERIGVCIMGAVLLDAGVDQEEVSEAEEDNLIVDYEELLTPYGFRTQEDVDLMIMINDGEKEARNLLGEQERDLLSNAWGEEYSRLAHEAVKRRLDRGLDKILEARIELVKQARGSDATS